ncbi:MAG TPA: PEP-CTERM sorting domain-containing protein [Pirellulales bacterium]|jgi:hypothetical protein
MRRNIARIFASVAGVLAVTTWEQVSQGMLYTIDPTQSYLQVSVQSSGEPLSLPQFSGSDLEALSGTLNILSNTSYITISSSPGSITFGTQSGIYPNATGGDQAPGTTSPLPDLAPHDPNIGNPQTANYGLTLIIPRDPNNPGDLYNLNTASAAGYAAIDSALASLQGTAFLNGNSLDASGLTMSLDAGNWAYNVNFGNSDYNPPAQNFQTGSALQDGTAGLAGYSNTNMPTMNGSFSNDLSVTIPINVTMQVNTGLVPLDVIFTGQIVAVNLPVPEPSTLILAALGGLALLTAGIQKHRRCLG